MELTYINQFMDAALPWILLGLAIAFAAVASDRRTQAGKKGTSIFTSIAGAALVASLFCFAVPSAYAATTDLAVEDIKGGSTSLILGDDLLWVGSTKSFTGIEAENDILAAGQSVRVDSCTVNGSVRLSGMSVAVDDSTVAHSITLAGESVDVTGPTTAQAVALCGSNVRFEGTTNSLWIAGATVYIDAVVHGDAHVSAQSLVLGPNASIEGTLSATLGQDPTGVTADNVKVLDVTIDTSANDVPNISALFGFSFLGLFLAILFAVVTALLIEWLARRQTLQSAEMVKSRTGCMLGTGAIAAVLAPIALVVLLVTVVGIPIAFALGCALVAIQIVAIGFAGASLGKVAFPKINRFGSASAMAAIIGAASALPFVGWLIDVAAFMYLLGYILQKVYLGLRNKPAQPAAEAPTQAPAETVDLAVPTNSVE